MLRSCCSFLDIGAQVYLYLCALGSLIAPLRSVSQREPERTGFAIIVNPVDGNATLVQIVGDFDADRARELDAAVESPPAEHAILVNGLADGERLIPSLEDVLA